MIKKNTEKKKTENNSPKFKGMVSKKVKRSAIVDLGVDVLCPPLGAIRHFKRKWEAGKTVEMAEQAVDTVLEKYPLEDLAKIVNDSPLVSVGIEKTEEETKEEREEA